MGLCLGSLGSSIACCFGNAFCSLCCSACPACKGSTSTRIAYSLILLAGLITSCIMLIPGLENFLHKIPALCKNTALDKQLLTKFNETKCQGLHIHCPDGAISKDGPSAGAAITAAIYSIFNTKHIHNDLAITGEINLQGEVTAIGGLDMKLSGGIRAGIKTFLYPESNHRDFLEWKKNKKVPDDIMFHKVSNIQDVFKLVFM